MDRSRNDSEAGFSLLEMIIAVALMGLAVVVIVGGMSVSIFASDKHRKQVDATAVLLSAAERVKSSATPYVSCATVSTIDYTTAAQAASRPAGWAAPTITQVAYWNGSTFVVGAANCHDNDTFTDPITSSTRPLRLNLQQITLRVASPDGRSVESFSFVKRKPS